MLGLNIPLFNRANKARIAAGRLTVSALQSEYEALLKQQETAFTNPVAEKQKNEQPLKYYTSSALATGKLIADNANQQFASGAISYLDWIILTNQASASVPNSSMPSAKWNATMIEPNVYLNN